MTRSQSVAFASGAGAALLVVAGIYFGSGNFARFDTPLAAYAAATVFAAFAVAYRYAMWVQRPPPKRREVRPDLSGIPDQTIESQDKQLHVACSGDPKENFGRKHVAEPVESGSYDAGRHHISEVAWE